MTDCRVCGATKGNPHTWVEGTCVLPHRGHSRNLVAGAHVCWPCVERHQSWLTEIVELYATIGDVVPHGSIPDDTAEHAHTKKAVGSPAPWRIGAWAILHGQVNDHRTDDKDGHTIRSAYLDGNIPHFADVLAGWCDALNEHLGIVATPPATVSGAAAYLTARADKAVGMPGVDDYDAELRWLRRTLMDAHGLTDPQPLFACITVDCDGMVWRQDDGTEPQCSRCRRRYGTLDYVRAKRMQDMEASA